MNKISTLLTVGMLCLALNSLNAQIILRFDGGGDIPKQECWTFSRFGFNNSNGNSTNTSGNIATKDNIASLITPFIDITAGSTFQFDYKASNTAYNYNFTVRLISLSGSTDVGTRSVTNTSFSTFSYTVPATGTYRIAIEYSTNATKQFNENNIEIDNLIISGSFHYSNPCNLPPTAVVDTFNVVSFASPTVTGNVLDNDSDPNHIADPSLPSKGENLSVTLLTPVSSGSLTLNPNGSFTFTPNASFTGGSLTFTYTLNDNGYSPLTANATVTINYPTAPQATNDNFTSAILVPVTNTVITNDIKPTDKTLIATVVSGPASGNLSWNTNGTFTYTPQAGFGGGDITFTYQVSYDTYMPLLSNTATVTISYPALVPTPLPIKLLSFTGALVNNKAQLNWSVDDNETGRYFKVEKSTDGRHFIEAATIFPSATSGKQSYTFTEPIQSDKGVFYRLQIANTDAPIAYSKTVLVKPLITTAGTLTLLANPVQSTLRFTITSDKQEQNTLTIYTLNGIRVLTQPLSLVKGLNYLELNAAHLTKGMYIMEVVGKTTSLKTKFLK